LQSCGFPTKNSDISRFGPKFFFDLEKIGVRSLFVRSAGARLRTPEPDRLHAR
jgi:hypothetical protein